MSMEGISNQIRDETIRNVAQAYDAIENLERLVAYIRREGRFMELAIWAFYQANLDNWTSIPGADALLEASARWGTKDAGNFYPMPNEEQLT